MQGTKFSKAKFKKKPHSLLFRLFVKAHTYKIKHSENMFQKYTK